MNFIEVCNLRVFHTVKKILEIIIIIISGIDIAVNIAYAATATATAATATANACVYPTTLRFATTCALEGTIVVTLVNNGIYFRQFFF